MIELLPPGGHFSSKSLSDGYPLMHATCFVVANLKLNSCNSSKWCILSSSSFSLRSRLNSSSVRLFTVPEWAEVHLESFTLWSSKNGEVGHFWMQNISRVLSWRIRLCLELVLVGKSCNFLRKLLLIPFMISFKNNWWLLLLLHYTCYDTLK